MEPIILPSKKALLSASCANAIGRKLEKYPFRQRETGDWLEEQLARDERSGIEEIRDYPGIVFDAFNDDISFRTIRCLRLSVNNPRVAASAAKSLLKMQLLYMAFEKMGDPLIWPSMRGGFDV